MTQARKHLFAAEPPSSQYAIIPTQFFYDKNLCYAAKGILAVCLAQRHTFNKQWIVANSNESPQSINFALRQLKDAGYIKIISQGDQTMYRFLAQPEDPDADDRPPVTPAATPEPPSTPAKPRKVEPEPLPLESWLEPHREPLERWMVLRSKAHPKLPREITARSLTALEYAKQLNVLKEFCEIASESCWQSLGFAGYKALIEKIVQEKNPTKGSRPAMSAINYTL